MNGVRLLQDMQDSLGDLERRLDDIVGFLASLVWALDGLDSCCMFVIQVDNLQTALKGELGNRPLKYKGVEV